MDLGALAVGIFIPNPSVSMLGGIQPAPVRTLAASATNHGLIQRFLDEWLALKCATIMGCGFGKLPRCLFKSA